MNTLDDLRHTLDQHSHDAAGIDPVTRRNAVGARIASAKRRRNAVRGGLVAATVVAVAGTVALPMLGGGDDAGPAGRTLLGQQAPAKLSTYDNTYRFLEGFEDSSTSELDVEVGYSDETRILTWATAGDDQDVRVDGPWDARWDSSRADFDDWVTIPEGFEGTVTVTSSNGAEGLGAALYAADPTALPDVVEAFHGQYFRAEGPNVRRVGVAVGEQGQTELRFPYRDAGPHLSIVVSCDGVPAGLTLHAEREDGGGTAGRTNVCQGDGAGARSDFISLRKDLGIDPNYRMHLREDGTQSDGTVRVWISRSMKNDTPVDPAEYPDARLAAAAYSTLDEHETLPGDLGDVASTVWVQGHVWRFDRVIPDVANQPQDISAATTDGPALAMVVTGTYSGPDLSSSVAVDGDNASSGSMLTSSEAGGSTTVVLPRGSKVLEARAEPAGKAGSVDQTVVLYRLVP